MTSRGSPRPSGSSGGGAANGDHSDSSGNNSPRLESGAPSKVTKSSGWRAASHIGSVVDDWPMYSSQATDYILGAPVGFGASSIVYQASFQPLNGRACAVKVIDLEAFGRDLAELRRETQLMSLSKHPNVLRVRGCWVQGAKLHIATRLMNAGSMLDIMRFNFADGFEETVIATVLKQALEGLNYLHINGWLHRDLKAANMLVDEDGTVLLGDFGVGVYLTETDKQQPNSRNAAASMPMHDAHNTADTIDQAARKSFVGTPCWMAPEVVERKGYGTKADIWSFGITALELSSGRAPHSRLPPVKVLMHTLQDDPPRLDRDNGAHKYSKLFDDFVRQCLQKDPSKRPSAEKLLHHGFFKHAKPKKYLVSTILESLPPLTERQERRRRAMSVASMQNQASWDFGSVGSQFTPHARNGSQDPFANFSGIVASPRGSVRSSRLISIDGEHAIVEDATTNVDNMRELWLNNSVGSARGKAVVEHGGGSWNRRQSRNRRRSVSFDVDVDEREELSINSNTDSTTETSGDRNALHDAQTNDATPATTSVQPPLPSIDETLSGLRADTISGTVEESNGGGGSSSGGRETPSLTDISAPSSKPASLETPSSAPHANDVTPPLKQKTRQLAGGRLSNLFKRS